MKDHSIVQSAEVVTTGQHTEEGPPRHMLKDLNQDATKILYITNM